MKEILKQYFPLILTVLCVIYAIYVIFHSISEIGEVFQNALQKNNQTLVAKSLSLDLEADIPTPIYTGNTLTIENGYDFYSLFHLKQSDDTLYLVDVKSSNNISVLSKLSTSSIDSLYQIPSSAVYDTDQDLLYFYNSGIYTLVIRLYHNHRPGILFECQVPVEMR